MNKIFTLIAFLASTILFAQTTVPTIDFNNSSLPAGSCWINNGLTFSDGLGNNNNTNAVVVNASYASLTTPFINMAAGGTVSFGTNASVTKTTHLLIRVSTIDKNGTITPVDSVNPVKNNAYPVTTATINTAGSYKILIELMKLPASTGNDESSIDNLNITGTFDTYDCNTAPEAVNDTYTAPVVATYTSSHSVLANDAGAAGETLVPSVIASPDGSVELAADGSFTFKPYASFTGGLTSFTYQITDNGFAPLSDTAIVSINFPSAGATPLPIKLVSFAGALGNHKVHLKWIVADNETGDNFKILKSTNGTSFTEIGTVLTNEKAGSETYTFIDNNELLSTTYYKLKIINKDHSISYSTIVALKPSFDIKINLSVLENPVSTTLHFSYTTYNTAKTMVSIYNAAGMKVFTTSVNSQKGFNIEAINLGNTLSGGIYILEVVNGNERHVSRLSKK